MSLWDWLLAAWIYDELFDHDSDTILHDNTCDYDSSYDYDDYEDGSVNLKQFVTNELK